MLLLLFLPNHYLDLLYSSIPKGITLPGSSFMRIVPMYPLARVFPTPPLSLCCLPVPAVSFVGFHKLHIGSWLLSLSCRLSLAYGCAQVANRGWMWHLLRRCSTLDKESDEWSETGLVELCGKLWKLLVSEAWCQA
ncbi:hypothetical protein D8674_000168 [Pyrus ussuriensis x Pyrus communis]|uniref:Uncharacterized protein n=1 Tax=Pyrus ussuriensis x Pyrus communis TaxID=2448454 RepID=A0A5N5F2C2_9ROSA|nr:hypothetical protein D8674_000168 [Pyrus ussuriensis x Pyrus communis]